MAVALMCWPVRLAMLVVLTSCCASRAAVGGHLLALMPASNDGYVHVRVAFYGDLHGWPRMTTYMLLTGMHFNGDIVALVRDGADGSSALGEVVGEQMREGSLWVQEFYIRRDRLDALLGKEKNASELLLVVYESSMSCTRVVAIVRVSALQLRQM